MSEYTGQEKFTEDDIDKDGEIKKFVGQKLADKARKGSEELWDAFVDVCEEKGIKPRNRLGEMALRCLEDPDLADRVFYQEVDMRQIKGTQMTKDDMELVLTLSEELGLNEDNDDDLIDNLVKQRLESVGGSPLSGIADSVTQEDSAEIDALRKEVSRLNQKLEAMSNGDSQKQIKEDSQQSRQSGSKKDLDDVFSEEEEDVQKQEEQEQENQTKMSIDVPEEEPESVSTEEAENVDINAEKEHVSKEEDFEMIEESKSSSEEDAGFPESTEELEDE